MKYEVEYKKTSYVVLTVEAETQEDADAEAWKLVEQDYNINNACWELESIKEVTTNQGDEQC